jgi:hypothetical protein
LVRVSGGAIVEVLHYEAFAQLENRDPSARWTFFDPAPPRFAAKTKLALRAQTVVFAGAEAAGAGCPEKSPMRAYGIRFSIKVSLCPMRFAIFFINEKEVL